MRRETLNYIFDINEQDDKNIGVIHVYRKNDNAWFGFIRYIKKNEQGKPFVKFFASDLGHVLDSNFKKELSQFSKELSNEWVKDGGLGFNTNSNLDVKFTMVIDKGDGTPPKTVVA